MTFIHGHDYGMMIYTEKKKDGHRNIEAFDMKTTAGKSGNSDINTFYNIKILSQSLMRVPCLLWFAKFSPAEDVIQDGRRTGTCWGTTSFSVLTIVRFVEIEAVALWLPVLQDGPELASDGERTLALHPRTSSTRDIVGVPKYCNQMSYVKDNTHRYRYPT